jgi:hypothetical protein
MATSRATDATSAPVVFAAPPVAPAADLAIRRDVPRDTPGLAAPMLPWRSGDRSPSRLAPPAPSGWYERYGPPAGRATALSTNFGPVTGDPSTKAGCLWTSGGRGCGRPRRRRARTAMTGQT